MTLREFMRQYELSLNLTVHTHEGRGIALVMQDIVGYIVAVINPNDPDDESGWPICGWGMTFTEATESYINEMKLYKQNGYTLSEFCHPDGAQRRIEVPDFSSFE